MRLQDFVVSVQSRFRTNGGIKYGAVDPVVVLVLLVRLAELVVECRKAGRAVPLERLVTRAISPGWFDLRGRAWRAAVGQAARVALDGSAVHGGGRSSLVEATLDACSALSERELEGLLKATLEYARGPQP